jgi:hypothetical protein
MECDYGKVLEVNASNRLKFRDSHCGKNHSTKKFNGISLSRYETLIESSLTCKSHTIPIRLPAARFFSFIFIRQSARVWNKIQLKFSQCFFPLCFAFINSDMEFEALHENAFELN